MTEDNSKEYVWYVCYGSNLLEERFNCYITDRIIPGNTRLERGIKETYGFDNEKIDNIIKRASCQ